MGFKITFSFCTEITIKLITFSDLYFIFMDYSLALSGLSGVSSRVLSTLSSSST